MEQYTLVARTQREKVRLTKLAGEMGLERILSYLFDRDDAAARADRVVQLERAYLTVDANLAGVLGSLGGVISHLSADHQRLLDIKSGNASEYDEKIHGQAKQIKALSDENSLLKNKIEEQHLKIVSLEGQCKKAEEELDLVSEELRASRHELEVSIKRRIHLKKN